MTSVVVANYQSIVSTYNTSNPLTKLPANLFFEQIPETSPQLPVVVFEHLGEIPPNIAYTTGSTLAGYINGKFAINIYFNDLLQVDAWATVIMQEFGPTSMLVANVNGVGNTVTRRELYRLECTDLRDAAGNPCYKATIIWNMFFNWRA